MANGINLQNANISRGRNAGRTPINTDDTALPVTDFQEAATHGGLLDRIADWWNGEPEVVCDPSLPEALTNGSAARVVEFHFDTNSADLSQADIGKGMELLESFGDNAQLTGYLVGCADTVASEEHNLELAQARADKIGGILGTFGLQANIIAFSGGEACPIVGPDDTASADSRRTTVFLHERPQGSPAATITGGP